MYGLLQCFIYSTIITFGRVNHNVSPECSQYIISLSSDVLYLFITVYFQLKSDSKRILNTRRKEYFSPEAQTSGPGC